MGEHGKSHTQLSLYHCEICSESFIYENVLNTHLESHRQLYKCKHCESSFNNESALKEHNQTHMAQDDFKCEKCGMTFRRQEELEDHKRIHVQTVKQSENECSKCGKVYSNMSKLRRHDWRSHRTVDCSICGLSIESREQITNHRKTEHNMSKKIKCRYFPNCIDEDECFFEHDDEKDKQKEEPSGKSRYCLKGENCQDQSCEYSEVNHLNVKNVMCRFQSKCNKSECMFKHIMERASFLTNCTQNFKKK